MMELFPNISDEIREKTKSWIDLVLMQNNIINAIKAFKAYKDSCRNDEEKAFIDFYFKTRLETLINENYNDQREKRLW